MDQLTPTFFIVDLVTEVVNTVLGIPRLTNSRMDDSYVVIAKAIEDTLDQGRIGLALSDSGTEHGATVTTKLDELRSLIRKLSDQLGGFLFLLQECHRTI